MTGEDIDHEEAMRQAAAERRRSQSARKPSHSPTNPNAERGPGPSTDIQPKQWDAKRRALEADKADGAHHTTGTSSPMMVVPESTSSVQVKELPESNSSLHIPVPAPSTGTVKPSPFHTSDTPGSWGSAIPMSVQSSSRPRSHTLKSTFLDDPAPQAGPSVLQKHQFQSNADPKPPSPQTHHPELPVYSTKQVRKGPIWRTAESPPPAPSQEVLLVPLPPQLIDMDQSDMEESSHNVGGASLGEQSLSGPTMTSPISRDVDMQMTMNATLASDRTSSLPDLPYVQLDVEPDSLDLQPAGVPSDNQAIEGTIERVPVGEETALIIVTNDDGPAHFSEKISFLSDAGIGLLLGPSNPARDDVAMGGRLGDVPALDAALLELLPADETDNLDLDQAVNIDDLSASLPEEIEQIDLTRSRESSSSGSFEEIPAEIAITQIVFSRPTATQSSGRSGPSQPIAIGAALKLPNAPEQGVISTPDDIAPGAIAHLKAPHAERAQSSSSSSSGSPPKRLSTRLASRTMTPVYNFGKSSEPIKWRQTAQIDGPIKWRQIVEMDGESDVEDLLRAPSRAGSSGSSSMTIDGVERTLTATYNIPIVDSPPPPERRSRAIREFDTQLIDEWNKLSPGLTHNPPLHRLIFESYIERCVDNEPEIKVYNSVDFESIPPNFEFQYSNEMLYNEDVPEPELGLGCDCEGGCSVTSETCSCLKRQRLYNFDINEDFAYDEYGELKQPVPIWECGSNCGCPPECMNRVIQRGRTEEALIDLFKTVGLQTFGELC